MKKYLAIYPVLILMFSLFSISTYAETIPVPAPINEKYTFAAPQNFGDVYGYTLNITMDSDGMINPVVPDVRGAGLIATTGSGNAEHSVMYGYPDWALGLIPDRDHNYYGVPQNLIFKQIEFKKGQATDVKFTDANPMFMDANGKLSVYPFRYTNDDDVYCIIGDFTVNSIVWLDKDGNGILEAASNDGLFGMSVETIIMITAIVLVTVVVCITVVIIRKRKSAKKCDAEII